MSTALIIKQFENLNIEIYGTYEEPLFKAKDIGELLGIERIRDSIVKLDEQCKIMIPAGTTGGNREQWFLTEDGLYEMLFISRKPLAKQFRIWIRNMLKEIRLTGKYELEKQIEEKDKLIDEQKNKLLEYKQLKYEEVEKRGHVYILSTDKHGVYKCGKTRVSVKNRKSGLQTGCVNTIKILFDFQCSNENLLENSVHYILDRYRCNSNREHFKCDIEYMKMVIEYVGKTIDTCKSSYDNIEKEELKNKLRDKIDEDLTETTLEYKEYMVKEFTETYLIHGSQATDRLSENDLQYYYDNYCNLKKLFVDVIELKMYLAQYLNIRLDRNGDLAGYRIINKEDIWF
jgi:prophage antirepressor-like protein